MTVPLQLRTYPVRQVALGDTTGFVDGVLTIDVARLREQLVADTAVGDVEISLVAPDERARIINVVDVIQPRIKPALAEPDYYPGVGTEPFLVGSGPTNVLDGVTVMTTALLDQAEDMVVSCEPDQPLRSRFADCWNVVVSFTPAPGATNELFARAVTTGGCRAAVAVARATLAAEPAAVDEIDLDAAVGRLPRVGYICYLYSHGFARQKLVYGRDSAGMLPTVVPLTHLLDGAIVDNGYTRPVRNTTLEVVNNAVAAEVARGHGRDHVVAGAILVPHATQLKYKAQFAQIAAEAARDLLRCDGVVITKDGGGQADVDLMQVIAACESRGMRAVAAVSEIAGEDGDLLPLVTTVPEADALVSLGNLAAPITLAPVDRVVGGPKFGRATEDPRGAFTFPMGQVPGLIDMLGGTGVRARAF